MYSNEKLCKWLKKNHNKIISETAMKNWLKPDKIMRVFGKSKDKMIAELKMESL